MYITVRERQRKRKKESAPRSRQYYKSTENNITRVRLTMRHNVVIYRLPGYSLLLCIRTFDSREYCRENYEAVRVVNSNRVCAPLYSVLNAESYFLLLQ